MKKMSFLKKIALAFTAVAFTAISFGASSVNAAQIPYNPGGMGTSDTPVFNTFTGVPNGVGNETNFVTLRKSTGDPKVTPTESSFSDPLSAQCTVGEKFDIRTYVHNGANPAKNEAGSGSAVARNVNVAMTAQLGVTKKDFVFGSTISSNNAASISDNGTLNCGNNVQLKLVASSVKVYSKTLDWKDASDSAVNGNLKIGSESYGSGDVYACWDGRVLIVYVVEVVEAPKQIPEVRCEAITVEKLGGKRKYKYGVRYTATNGATLKNVKYNFSDNTSQTVTAPFTVEKEFAKEGEFKTTTDLTFVVDGADKVVTDAKCATTIKTDVEPCEYDGRYAKGAPECLPPVIPSTGAGSMIGGLVGSSATAYGAYALYQKRKALKSLK